jgi:hypothetical protein
MFPGMLSSTTTSLRDRERIGLHAYVGVPDITVWFRQKVPASLNQRLIASCDLLPFRTPSSCWKPALSFEKRLRLTDQRA